jgi:hypothetical protein
LVPALLSFMGFNRKLTKKSLGSDCRLLKTPTKLALLGAVKRDFMPKALMFHGWLIASTFHYK